jgi:hypothetical protein
MASFLTSSQRDSINATFANLHDTFKKSVYVYTESVQEKADYSDYNPLYGRSHNESISPNEILLTKEEIQARVYYPEAQKEEVDQFKSASNLRFSQGRVRLKVDYEGLQKILTASKVEVDDVLWLVDGDPKPVGPFSTIYYSIWLRREN